MIHKYLNSDITVMCLHFQIDWCIMLQIAFLLHLQLMSKYFKYLIIKKNSAGWDGLTQFLVKPIFLNVTEPLTHVMNLSLAQGIVPLEHKIAKGTPLFKNDNKMYVNNYSICVTIVI